MFKLALKTFMFLGLKIILASPVQAAENRWTHFGVRPLAMGNAFVSVADDFNALFYNPAGLARISSWDGELLNPAISFGTNTSDSFSEVLELFKSDSEKLANILNALEDKTGKNLHFAIDWAPHLIFRNFGFGLGLRIGGDLTAHSDIEIEVKSGLDIIMPFSYAKNFLNDRLSVGATVKARIFAGVKENFDIESIDEFQSSNDSSETDDNKIVTAGNGLGGDVGILFTPIQTMEPTLGISITDIGGTKFSKRGDPAKAPENILASVNTGFSFKPYNTKFSYVRVAVEAHSINQPIHYSKKLHFGTEWAVSSIFSIQSGLNDGYLSGGFEFDVGLLNLRYATYAVDHGPIVGLNNDLVDRRHVIQAKLLL